MEIVKVLVPAAGLGARFLPYTKAIPKEMIPLLNKPAIQYIAEEGLQSDIANFIMIVGKNKEAIANHFDSSAFLESMLKEKDRDRLPLLASIEKLSRLCQFTYIRQSEPLGLGHAVWLARNAISKEYFGIALPDDIIISKQPALSQLIRVARQEKASVIAVQEVPTECISSYGIVGIKKQITPSLFQLSHIVEKPHPKDAPSSLAVVGRYILSSKVFNSLEHLSTYATPELQLTDAISHMMQHNERVFAYKVQGTRYDLGTPLGWIKAVIGSSLQDAEYGPHIRKFLASLHTTDSFMYNPAKTIEHSL
jgi:UTP--glucose-1-phosphate uridylyltransferase